MSETDDRSQADRERDDSASAPAPEEEVLRAAGHMLGEGRELAQDYLDLLAVEGQLAGRSLVLMLALAIVLGVLLVAAWIFLNLAGAMWAVDNDMLGASAAFLLVTAAHVVAALLAWLAVRHLAGNLVFGGFRRALQRRASRVEDRS